MRKLTVRILRAKPGQEKNAHFDEYCIEEKPRMSVLLVLDEIKETKDPSIYYESVCRSSICGSCAIKINGQPKLACKTQTSSLPDKITLEPLDVFPLIKDLAVDKSQFFEELNKKLETWVHRQKEFKNLDEKISEELASQLYESERCIECGICISACVAASCAKFMGASGCGKGLRFVLDPRNEDKEAIKKLISVLASDEGLWGCHGIGACEKFCPKEINLLKQLGKARIEVLKLIVKEWLKKPLKK